MITLSPPIVDTAAQASMNELILQTATQREPLPWGWIQVRWVYLISLAELSDLLQRIEDLAYMQRASIRRAHLKHKALALIQFDRRITSSGRPTHPA